MPSISKIYTIEDVSQLTKHAHAEAFKKLVLKNRLKIEIIAEINDPGGAEPAEIAEWSAHWDWEHNAMQKKCFCPRTQEAIEAAILETYFD